MLAQFFVSSLAFALTALTLPLVLWTSYLLVLAIAAAWPRRKTSSNARLPKFAVLVPAHNEEAAIHSTVASIHWELQWVGGGTIQVVADNCNDATADRARAAGANVIERYDPLRRGKGWALQAGVEALEANPAWDVLVVIDADTELDDGFFLRMANEFRSGSAIVQAHYAVKPEGSHWRSDLLVLAWSIFNYLRPLGRTRLGASAPVLGNGFALRRELLDKLPLASASVVEDAEWGLRAVLAGERVDFAPEARLWARPETNAGAAAPQRARWEAGRLGLYSFIVPLLKRRRLRSLEAALDLSVPPLSLLGAGLSLSLVLTLSLGFEALSLALGFSLLSLFAVTLTALWRSGAGLGPLRSLPAVPRYLAWKLALYGQRSFWSAARTWVRTPRLVKEGASR
jgi:1,2-diacylglycerol 3-beta-glucosyltransferase